jgi:prolyl-tRNA editing enzyme YbaK/EbsC (Cys-tRNA(Pro) deacylase)
VRDKVMEVARELGLEIEVRTLDTPTRTVEEAAHAIGCGPAQIAKSIVFVADGDPVVCVTSGAHRVDAGRLCDVLDSAEVRPAAPDEVRAATGFGVGGVPPFGHGLPVVFDEALLEHAHIWAAGGDGNSLFCVEPRRLADCLGARITAVADTP